MKKSLITLLLLAAVTVQSCVTPISKKNKVFIGKWKRIDKPADEMIIQRDANAFVVITGKDKFSFVSDQGRNQLKLYFMQTTALISYIEKTDHILFNKGEDGEYARIE